MLKTFFFFSFLNSPHLLWLTSRGSKVTAQHTAPPPHPDPEVSVLPAPAWPLRGTHWRLPWGNCTMLQDGGRSPSACWLAREQTAPERRRPGPARPGPARQNPAGAPEAAPGGGADAAPRPHDGCLRAARDGTELTTGRTAGDGVRGPVRTVQAAATAPTQLLTAESGRSRLTHVKYTAGFRHVVLKNGRQLANVSYQFDVETVTFVSVLGYVKCIKINFHCFSFRLNDLAFKLSGPRLLTPRREGEPARSPPRAITRLKGNGNAFLEKAQRRADERRPCSSRPAAASEARGVRKHSDRCGDRVSPQPPSPPALPVDEGGARWSPWGAWPPGPLRPHAAPAAGGSGSEARPPGPDSVALATVTSLRCSSVSSPTRQSKSGW